MDTAVRVAVKAKEEGIPITLDIGQNQRDPKIETLLSLADYVIPSLAFSRRYTQCEQGQSAARALQKRGAKAVIQTLGEQGAFVATGEGQNFTVPAFPVQVVDTTGAGDSFHGGFLFALSRGYSLQQGVVFASAVAALKCTRPALISAGEEIPLRPGYSTAITKATAPGLSRYPTHLLLKKIPLYTDLQPLNRNLALRLCRGLAGQLKKPPTTGNFHGQHCEGADSGEIDQGFELVQIDILVGVQLGTGDCQTFTPQELPVEIPMRIGNTIRRKQHLRIFEIRCRGRNQVKLDGPLPQLGG